MNKITIREVVSKSEMRDFVQLPKRIYADNPCYVPDLDSDMEALCRKAKTFVAYDEKGEAVGRVATFISEKANAKWQRKAARFSYIDFIDDREVSAALMEAVEEWAASQGMETVMGPLGWYDLDKEGLLVEGFDKMGAITEYYNASYYHQHLEALGYTKEVDWVQTRMAIPTEVPKTYFRVSRYVESALGLKVRKLTNKEMLEGGYGLKILDLVNECYDSLFGYTKMSQERSLKYIKRYLPLVDLDMIPVVMDPEGNVVAACVTMTSLSKAMRKAGGKLLPFGWWHLLKALKWGREDTVQLLLIAVRPDMQGYGVSAMLFDDLIPIFNKKGYKWAETGPQLDYNSKELTQWKPLNPEVVKRRRCYKKEIR